MHSMRMVDTKHDRTHFSAVFNIPIFALVIISDAHEFEPLRRRTWLECGLHLELLLKTTLFLPTVAAIALRFLEAVLADVGFVFGVPVADIALDGLLVCSDSGRSGGGRLHPVLVTAVVPLWPAATVGIAEVGCEAAACTCRDNAIRDLRHRSTRRDAKAHLAFGGRYSSGR
jgi:hypothetical protein